MMLAVLFVAAFAAAARASDVLEFTDDDFDSKIGQHDLILVEFFAPWWVEDDSAFLMMFSPCDLDI